MSVMGASLNNGISDGIVDVAAIREKVAISNDRALLKLMDDLEDQMYAGKSYGFRKSERYRSLSDSWDIAMKEALDRKLDV